MTRACLDSTTVILIDKTRGYIYSRDRLLKFNEKDISFNGNRIQGFYYVFHNLICHEYNFILPLRISTTVKHHFTAVFVIYLEITSCLHWQRLTRGEAFRLGHTSIASLSKFIEVFRMSKCIKGKLKDPRTCRIFFSSPFGGMEEERDELTRKYFPQLQHLCSSRGVQFVPVDMRWGITSEAADKAQTVNICLKEVDRCDIFVGFYGQVRRRLLKNIWSLVSADYRI